MSVEYAIVFLGNPGKTYEKTRHNAGFQFSEQWLGLDSLTWKEKFKGVWATFEKYGKKIYALKPLTMMNLSGESVQAMLQFFKLGPEQLIVVYDEIELPFAEVRLQLGGGLAGHNGLRSIKQHVGTDRFHRLRIGIGRPARGDVASFVLSRFSSDEEIELSRVFQKGAELLETFFSS